MKLTVALALALLGVSGAAGADTQCPHPIKPPQRHRPRKAPPVKPPEKSCECIGHRGPPGPKGDRGEDGKTSRDTYTVVPLVVYRSAISVRAGVMGAWYFRDSDWSWGPALQVAAQLSDEDELTVDAAFTGPFNGDGSPGREDGFIGHLGLTRAVSDGLGLTAGVHYAKIDGSTANRLIDGRYVALDAGIVLRQDAGPFNFRFELTPTIGSERDTFRNEARLDVGLVGSLFVGFR